MAEYCLDLAFNTNICFSALWESVSKRRFFQCLSATLESWGNMDAHSISQKILSQLKFILTFGYSKFDLSILWWVTSFEWFDIWFLLLNLQYFLIDLVLHSLFELISLSCVDRFLNSHFLKFVIIILYFNCLLRYLLASGSSLGDYFLL
jgi:hypothetical protein